MWKQIQGIGFFYTRPLVNKFILHSKTKWLIYAVLASVLLAGYMSDFFGDILRNANWGTRLMLIITECIFVGLLRGMNTLPQQMYGDRLLTLFHVSGISPVRMILGQSISSLPMYAWSSLMVSIPLTIGYSITLRLLYGCVFIFISMIMIWLTDILSRFLLIITMKHIPSVAKTFAGISTAAYAVLIGLLIWCLVSIDSISGETWDKLVIYLCAFAILFVLALLVLLMFAERIGQHYYESWLNYLESEQRGQRNEEQTLSTLVHNAYDAIVLKDITLLFRNPLTRIRLGLWLIAIIAGAFITRYGVFDSFINSNNLTGYSLLFVTLLSSLIFGEVVSTLYQMEGQNYILYYVTAVKGKTIFGAKLFVASLLLVVPSILGFWIIAVILQLPFVDCFIGGGLAFIISFGSIIVQLTLASMDRTWTKGTNLQEGSVEEKMLEQSPRKPIPIISAIVGLLYIVLLNGMSLMGVSVVIILLVFLGTTTLGAAGLRYSER